MRLRQQDLDLAKSTKHLSSITQTGGRSNSGGDYRRETVHTARQLLDYAEGRLKELGYTLRKKNGSKNWKHKRMSTAGRKIIWLGVTWDEKTIWHKAATLMHELVHANQSRAYGFKRWLGYYIGSARFRFAMEAQAYRETCRAYRVMGRSERSIGEYAARLPNRFVKSYFIVGRRMRKDVRKWMPGIVVMP